MAASITSPPDRMTRDLEYLNFQVKPSKKLCAWFFYNYVQSACRKIDFSSKEIKVLLIGHIQNDGIGDYFHLLHAAKVIQTLFPKAQISIGAEVIGLSTRHIPPSPFPTMLWEASLKMDDYIVEDSPEKEQCILTAADATIILELPHSIRDLPLPLPPSTPYTRIYEYGTESEFPNKIIGENTTASPTEKQVFPRFSMGLGPWESGLIWKEAQGPATLEDEMLRQLFADSPTPILHFGYLSEEQLPGFVNICLALDAADSRSCIAIVVPHNFVTEEEVQKFLKKISSCSVDVKEIAFLKKKGEEKFYPINAQGSKTVRLINPFPLANTDLLTLITLSSGCVGCTGDSSLSEVLSERRIPFYQVRAHKATFMTTLQILAQEQLGSASPLVDYFSLLIKNQSRPQWEAQHRIFENQRYIDKARELLSNPLLAKEMEEFSEYLQTHYNFNEALLDIVARNLALAFFPTLKEYEDSLLERYLKKEKSAEECREEYAAFISQF